MPKRTLPGFRPFDDDVIVIRGPEVGLYHDKLAQGLADIAQANGTDITSVLYYPPASGEEEEEGAGEVERYA